MTSKHVTDNIFRQKSSVLKEPPFEKEPSAKNVKWREIVLLKNVVEGKMLQIGGKMSFEKALATYTYFEKTPKEALLVSRKKVSV